MIRRVIEFAIDKPVLNHLFLLFLTVLSVISYMQIPKEIFPPFQADKIIVSGGYIGASANVLDKIVVRTIEDDLKNVSEIETIDTVIKNGAFQITADIKQGSHKELVLSEIKDIISNTKRDLPADMDEPIAKVVDEVIPLVLVAIAGEVSTKELLVVADELKSSLSEFKELSDIAIRGDADEELVITLNEEKIEALGLSLEPTISALTAISSIFPIGTVQEQGRHLYISTKNGEKEIRALEKMLIGVGNKRVRLTDIANIGFSLADPTQISHFNGLLNVSININKSKDGNAIALVKDIRAMLKTYEKQHPHLVFKIYTDTSIWIKNRLNTVFSNILFGLFLVFLALLLSVNSGIALVVALGIPLSFMMGLIATYLIGFSLNMLSLLGALIALGMLVDEAIVVAENIYRHLEAGVERREAVIVGSLEMFPAVLTATLTTVFAFLPLLLISGEMGTFLRILPIMISVLLISSLFEAFYFLPLHAQDFLKVRNQEAKSHTFWSRLYSGYKKVMRVLLAHKKKSLTIMVSIIIGLTILFVKTSKFQLFPNFDVTQIYVSGRVDVNNDIKDTEAIVSQIERVLLKSAKEDEVSSITSIVGIELDAKNRAEVAPYLFHIFVDLYERRPENLFNKFINPHLSPEYDATNLIRPRDAKNIAEDFVYELKDLKSSGDFAELKVVVPSAGVVAHDVEISLNAKDDAKVVASLGELQKAMAELDGVENISDDAKEGERELKLRVNEYGQKLGLNESIINTQLRALYLGGEYGKMFDKTGIIRIVIEGRYKDNIERLESLTVTLPTTSQKVLLKEVCDFTYYKTFANIIKEDGKRIRSVFATLDKEKITSAELMLHLQPIFEKFKSESVNVDIKGEAKQNRDVQGDIARAAVVALFLIFLTLVWMFDSLILSLIVISTIPLSVLGGYFGHLIMGLNMSMPGMIGMVGLAGVVVNDGLLMVDFIKKTRNYEALMQRAVLRFRPIILTSVTTVLGLSTLMFFASGQSLILQPMAVSLGFGIAWATVLNLIYLPLLYSVIYRLKET